MNEDLKKVFPDVKEIKIDPDYGLRPDDRLMLILLPDGDIEIWTGWSNGYGTPIPRFRVRHRSYNPGDDLKQNLMEEYEELCEMEREVGI